MSLSLRRLSPVCLIGLISVACGKDTPVTPEPSPTPPPAAVATPTPVPAPAPVNARTACGVGAGSGDGLEEHCPRTLPSFLPNVDAAIDRVIAKHPEYFDLANVQGNGGYYVTRAQRYYEEVVQELGNAGLCAVVDGGGEIAVKSNNNFSDQYHIMVSAGYVRRGDNSYRATCKPAWF
jgi:hypothetical protein